jgi:hypothetical protein
MRSCPCTRNGILYATWGVSNGGSVTIPDLLAAADSNLYVSRRRQRAEVPIKPEARSC